MFELLGLGGPLSVEGPFICRGPLFGAMHFLRALDSRGPYGPPGCATGQLYNAIVKPLTIIINESLKTCTFPKRTNAFMMTQTYVFGEGTRYENVIHVLNIELKHIHTCSKQTKTNQFKNSIIFYQAKIKSNDNVYIY